MTPCGTTTCVSSLRAASLRSARHTHYVLALRDVVVALMIEKRETLDHLDEILAVPGIDMVQFGPSDFAMSAGVARPRLVVGGPRVWEADQVVKDAELRIIESALAAGVQPRAEIKKPAQARFYLDLGVRHFSMGTDLGILANWLHTEGGALRAELERIGLGLPEPWRVEVRRLRSVYPVYETATAGARATVDSWLRSLASQGVVSLGRHGLGVLDNLHHMLAMGEAAADAVRPSGDVDAAEWSRSLDGFAEHVVED